MTTPTRTRTFQLEAKITRNYGKHEITFGLTETVQCASTGQVKEAFLDLQSLLENQITLYEAVSLPHVQLPGVREQHTASEASADTFTLELIRIESSNGKKRIRAVGGKYTKHGVPVYEECATDLPLESLDYGNHNFKHLNLKVKVKLEDGKPKRAVSIR